MADLDANSKIGGQVPYHAGTIGFWYKGATAPTSTSDRVNFDGDLYATRLYNAFYNDYAELFEKGEHTRAGYIISLDPETNLYSKSKRAYDSLVVGVVSDEYGHLIGGKGDGNDLANYLPIGMAGRVRVNVTGRVRKGDLITSSDIPGVGMAAEQYIPGTILGKALEDHDGDEIHRIRILIMCI